MCGVWVVFWFFFSFKFSSVLESSYNTANIASGRVIHLLREITLVGVDFILQWGMLEWSDSALAFFSFSPHKWCSFNSILNRKLNWSKTKIFVSSSG